VEKGKLGKAKKEEVKTAWNEVEKMEKGSYRKGKSVGNSIN